MKRISLLVNSIMLLAIVSCGSDNTMGTPGGSSSKSAFGQECSFNSEYSPVCDTDRNVSHDNSSIAKCKGAINLVPAHCSPDVTLQVCARNKNTYVLHTMDEDTAVYSTEYGRNSIVKFSKCN